MIEEIGASPTGIREGRWVTGGITKKGHKVRGGKTAFVAAADEDCDDARQITGIRKKINER